MANRLDSGEVARPQSATCIAICNYEDRNVGAVVSSAVHTYDTRITYSAQAIGDHYQAFREKTELDPGELNKVRGDSATRIIVAGYSNSRRMELGQWGQQLWDNAGVRVYDGCRSSTMDIIGMIEGANDAYVDPRALWPDSGAMLQAYDITAVIPIAKGCGFVVSDVYGNPIENYAFDSNIPLVVSRTPELHGKILEAIKPLLEAQALAKS
jgi:fructose-1,6-bisphosphatase/inositol monophosphatase family enzyme